MKKKNWATRMISGLLSAMMVLTTVVTPMTVMASEIIPEDELREYVSSLPELKDVKDQLDPDEIVEAKDYEVDFGTEIDLKNDFTNMEIPNRDKVKVSFFEAKNAAGTDFSANNADTYKAVYYVEPMNEMHPVYRVSRSITVKEPVTEPQVSEEGNDSDDGQSGEEGEDAEADPVPESEAAMIPEPEAAESYVPDTFEDSEESSVFYEFTEEAVQEEMAAVTETVDEAGTADVIMAAESDAAMAEEEMMEEMAAESFDVSEEEAAESIAEDDDAGDEEADFSEEEPAESDNQEDEEDPPAADESDPAEADSMEESRMWQRKARRKSPPLWRKAYPRKRLRQRLRQQFRRQRVLLNLRLQLQNQRQTRKWSW